MTAQIIGIVAMGINILSYQLKTKRSILFLQMIGTTLFAINMYMLGALSGCLLNSIGVLRTVVYMQRDRKGFPVKAITGAFILMYAVSYVLVFTIFEKEPSLINFLVELLPLIGMSALTVGAALTGTKAIRVCAFVNSPCWLIYNCINFVIGGILCEIFTIVSVILALVRLDKNSASQTSEGIAELE